MLPLAPHPNWAQQTALSTEHFIGHTAALDKLTNELLIKDYVYVFCSHFLGRDNLKR